MLTRTDEASGLHDVSGLIPKIITKSIVICTAKSIRFLCSIQFPPFLAFRGQLLPYHSIPISRPGGTPGWLWNLWPGSTELDHHNLNKRLGPVPPLYSLSRPRPAPTMGPAGHALHRPSCEPETLHTASTSGSRASSLHKILSRPPACTARTRQGQALHGLSRGPVT